MKKLLFTTLFSFCLLTIGFSQRTNSFKPSKDLTASLKIGDIKGEISDIKILNRKNKPQSIYAGGVMGDEPAMIILSIDKSSPLIAKIRKAGKRVIPSMELTAQIDGRKLEYKLDRCFVKSWSTSGDADDRPTEEVAFYYNKISFE